MLVGVFLLAGAVTLPPLGEPVGDSLTIYVRDSPVGSTTREGGSVAYSVLFKPDGYPESCSIMESTGNAIIEERACMIARRRFRFHPSYGVDGQRKYRIYEQRVVFRNREGDTPLAPVLPPPYILQVARLPDEGRPFIVNVNVEVDVAGGLVACAVADEESNPAYARAACDALPDIWRPMVEKDMAGQPVAYVRTLRVGFEQAAPG